MSIGIVFTGVVPSNGQGYLVGSGPNDATQNELIADFILTLTKGSDYGGVATHGDVISFANVATPGVNLGDYAPAWAEFWELVPAGTALPGFKYTYCPGPTLAAPTLNGGVLQITGAGAGTSQGGAEITEGTAYSGTTPSLDGQQIKARFWFVRGQ
jgi:hypothetical protein